MIAAKPKMGLVLLLAVGVVAAGVDTLVQGALSAREPEAKQAAEPKPPVERQPVRTDQYGDSLPEGAIARLGTLRFRHPKMVDSLVFTANGKTLVSACFDGIIRFWDPETGKETRRILSPDSRDWGSAPFRLAFLGIVRESLTRTTRLSVFGTNKPASRCTVGKGSSVPVWPSLRMVKCWP